MKDKTQDMKMIKSAVGKHEKNMHPGKTPTKLAKAAVLQKQKVQ